MKFRVRTSDINFYPYHSCRNGYTVFFCFLLVYLCSSSQWGVWFRTPTYSFASPPTSSALRAKNETGTAKRVQCNPSTGPKRLGTLKVNILLPLLQKKSHTTILNYSITNPLPDRTTVRVSPISPSRTGVIHRQVR